MFGWIDKSVTQGARRCGKRGEGQAEGVRAWRPKRAGRSPRPSWKRALEGLRPTGWAGQLLERSVSEVMGSFWGQRLESQ